MSISRGEFLKSLGKSLPGMVFNSGLAAAAHKALGKMVAASGEGTPAPVPAAAALPEAPQPTHIHTGPLSGGQVALTFDDGPTPGVTDRILDELKQRNLHATFFMIGRNIETHPELARRVLAEGHDIGNHTYTHPKLPTLNEDDAEAEIQKTIEVMRDVLHHRTDWFRPPFGALRPDQFGLLERFGIRSVMGKVSSSDWAQPGEDSIVSTVLEETQSGSIIICHDLYEQTANCTGRILDGLVERGFSPVTLSSLLA